MSRRSIRHRDEIVQRGALDRVSAQSRYNRASARPVLAMPRISIVITTYNRALLLVEAIKSVLDQSFHDYEIIVVDDHSTDDTPVRLSDFAGRIRYLRLEHCGKLGPVRNHGITAAQGDYVAFLDDDDLW